ncbi:MAG: DsbA family protein [Christensenellales bacterium]
MKRLIITAFTDPVCCWCWGTEPVFRALETRYPGEIEMRSVMGGLVEDLRDFADPDNGIGGGDPETINAQVAAHWLESARVHGMPIQTGKLRLFSRENPSTYPQNIAVKAAGLTAPDKAERFTRRLREATLAEGLPTGDPAVLADLAEQAGLDRERFLTALHDGRAERAFRTDLGLVRGLGVSVFPTFQLKTAQGRQMMMRGYNTREDFDRAISALTDGDLQPLASPPEREVLLWLIAKQGRLAREEVYQAFDFADRAEADHWVETLIGAGLLQREPAGTSWFVRAAGGGAA